MKYLKFSCRKYWAGWLKSDIKILFYKLFHKIDINGRHGSMLPQTGKGEYVSVYTKGQIIQLIDERGIYNEIRIIPYQPNHAIMIEIIKNGKVYERYGLGISELNKMSFSNNESAK